MQTMKHDSEPAFCRPNLVSMFDCKPDGYNTSEITSNEGDAGVDSGIDDSTKWNRKNDIDSDSQYRICSSKTDSFERDTFFYTDKRVMESELPELVVCYKDVVKDICIDEGVPSQDKVLVESDFTKEKRDIRFLDLNGLESFLENVCNTGASGKRGFTKGEEDFSATAKNSIESDTGKEKVVVRFPEFDGLQSFVENYSDKDAANKHGIIKGEEDTSAEHMILVEGDFAKESLNLELLDVDGLKSVVENVSGKDAAKQCHFEEVDFRAADKIVNDCSKNEIVPEKSIPVGSSIFDGNEWKNKKVSEEEIAPANICIVRSCDFDATESEEHSLQNSEAVSGIPIKVAAIEDSTNGSVINGLTYNSKIESGTITFDFGSSKSPAIITDEGLQNINSEKPLNDFSDNRPVSSQGEQIHGESSFSMVAPFSGLITYSGPIAYSGNVSLRSDSSTTSTRSFAFPILQSEWNSSPVRMVKADRRHFRKHRGWRQGLLCCRF